MTPGQVILALRGALILAAVIGAYLLWGEFVAYIRAPIVAELNETRQERDGERIAKEWLNQVIVNRAANESKLDLKVEGIARDLEKLKLQSPAARDWADTRIPDDVIGVSRYAPAETVLRDTGSGKGKGASTDRPQSGGVESGSDESQKSVHGSTGQGEQPAGVAGFVWKAWNRITGQKGVTP